METKSLADIRRIVEARKPDLERDYGVVSLGVFGSVVRGESRPGSDIDMLVEFNRPIGFFRFLELEELLGEYLGSKVDLVTRGALKPRIGKRILEEVAML